MLVEVCANSLESALNAEKAGADRIELCAELSVGGVTPSYGLMKAVAEKISIPVRVLIRPRSGDFMYSNEEFEIMKENIKLSADMGFKGFVSGILQDDFSLDVARTVELMQVAENMKFTFHRAFDWIDNPLGALRQLEEIGVDTILTSGQQNKAVNGIELLTALHAKAEDCTIMPGSGINVTNVLKFKERGFEAIHMSGVAMVRKLQDLPKVPMSSTQMISDIAIPTSSIQNIQQVIQCVK
jgi:copper homeostasis protein